MPWSFRSGEGSLECYALRGSTASYFCYLFIPRTIVTLLLTVDYALNKNAVVERKIAAIVVVVQLVARW